MTCVAAEGRQVGTQQLTFCYCSYAGNILHDATEPIITIFAAHLIYPVRHTAFRQEVPTQDKRGAEYARASGLLIAG